MELAGTIQGEFSEYGQRLVARARQQHVFLAKSPARGSNHAGIRAWLYAERRGRMLPNEVPTQLNERGSLDHRQEEGRKHDQ